MASQASSFLFVIQRLKHSPEGLDFFVKEVSRLLAARSRQRQPQREQAQHRLIEGEKELANITKAIKAGIFTTTTKIALVNAEAERTGLQEAITANETTVDKVVTLLPSAKERYWDLIEGLGTLSAKHLPQAREQVRALVGEIPLTPTNAGYLWRRLLRDAMQDC